MSLIHDALRKAAEENAKGEGRPSSWRDVAPLPARKRRLWPWLGLVLGLAALLVVWRGGEGEGKGTSGTSGTQGTTEKAAPAPVVEESSAAAKGVEPAEAPVPEPAKAAVPAPVPEPKAQEKVSRAQETPAPPPAAPPTTTAVPAVPVPVVPVVPDVPAVPDVPLPSSPKIIQPPAQTGQISADTYVLEASVDGKSLRLDFIVWSDSPFAQINGRQVGIGQQVDGFLVTAITREKVALETPTRRFFLAVR